MSNYNIVIFVFILAIFSSCKSDINQEVVSSASEDDNYGILSMQERAKAIDSLLKIRVERVLPELMGRTGIDMWILISREYNEDPVLETMLPAEWMSARRRTILVISYNGDSLNTYAIARYNVGDVFKKAWDKEEEPDQWIALRRLIEKHRPNKIGINVSENYALADGLPKTEYDALVSVLPDNYVNKLVSAEALAVGWLETRTSEEMALYKDICNVAHKIIAEGFSNKVITPGETTTDDVVWFFRQRVNDLGLKSWFHPTVSVQRSDSENFDHLRSFSDSPGDRIIMPGDLLHVDFGITYLRLNTDTQQHAYVLKEGEENAPQYLVEALKTGNRLQDILTSQFITARSGNDILAMALAKADEEGIKATIYTHPIGYHGHAAGPTIGMWDSQGGVPGTGDYPLFPRTAYSIELNHAVDIEQWGKEIRIMLEEDAYFDGDKVTYIDGRQEELLLIE
ncbi:M24 family metallopeptidase [Marinigracilibium pacificum]|uniref:Aminopeptidase P family protein n=1 Tax=Marinigracilibium pacificum TaxID=2729599 RepID=A0A848J080_9BACT|nr:M24 family metallopeptidase [Marinigracilibium pacificum]NMM48788.1 aminopeptidase P family protein [Marinigracilibium pacificum]